MTRDELADLRAVLAQLADAVARIEAKLEAHPTPQAAQLAECGDTLGYADLARLLGKGPRYFERFVVLQNRTGVQLLPEPLPGVRGRFSKPAVEKWLRSGTWRLAEAQRALRRSA